jgi:hypothetical protein
MIDAIFNMDGSSVVVVVVSIILLVWETLAFVMKKPRALLSTWMQKFGFRNPAAALIVGMFLGHFWMYFPPTIDDERVVCPHCRTTLVLSIDEETGDVRAGISN